MLRLKLEWKASEDVIFASLLNHKVAINTEITFIYGARLNQCSPT